MVWEDQGIHLTILLVDIHKTRPFDAIHVGGGGSPEDSVASMLQVRRLGGKM